MRRLGRGEARLRGQDELGRFAGGAAEEAAFLARAVATGLAGRVESRGWVPRAEALELGVEVAVLLAHGRPGGLDEGSLQPGCALLQAGGAALSGAFVYVDGNQVTLTGGDWNVSGTNYSAGNPDYAKLKMNPEKFKVSELGSVFHEALAAYDSKYLSVGAMDAQTVGANGRKRIVSWMQVA